MRLTLLAATLLTPLLVSTAHAADPIRITIIADLDDDIYDARAGRGGVDATRMAVEDFGGTLLGRPITVDALNDHNKPALAPGLATQAIDAGADLLMDVQNSPIAVAVGKVATERHRIAITTGAAVPALTRAGCSRYVYHYSFDSIAIETATAAYLAAQPNGKRWAAIVADAGFGKGALATMTPVIEAQGGTVAKAFIVPPKQADLAAIAAELKTLEPQVIAVLNAGADNDNQLAAINEAKLGAQLTTGLVYISDVDRTKDAYQGVVAAIPWYWNQDTMARTWSDRFAAAHAGRRPTAAQAADYSATTQWLQAAKTAGTTDADAVVKVLDGHTFTDMFARNATFRANDHMVTHDLLIAKIRPAATLPEPQAWYDILATIPAAQAFPPTNACKL